MPLSCYCYGNSSLFFLAISLEDGGSAVAYYISLEAFIEPLIGAYSRSRVNYIHNILKANKNNAIERYKGAKEYAIISLTLIIKESNTRSLRIFVLLYSLKGYRCACELRSILQLQFW